MHSCRVLLRTGLLVAALLGTTFSASVVQGAPTAAEINAARETYREGVALEAAGNWAGALAKFQSVASVKSTPRVRFHIGLCQERLGRWNEALGAYKMAISEASRDRAKDVIKEAEAAKGMLEGRIPKLTLRRVPGAEGATITLDGVDLGSSALNTPMPVDPGTHNLIVSMPGRETQRISIEIREGESKTFDVQPPAERAQTPVPSARPVAPAVVPSAAPAAEPRKSSKVVPWIVTGVGAASLVASGVFYYLRSTAISDLEDKCGVDLRCSEAERSTYDRGRTYTLVANVSLGVGIVGVGLGTVLLLTSGAGKPKEEPRVAGRSTPFDPSMSLMLQPSGMSLVGRF
ncbi:MAG: PEGA domain-containing protein [Deltaproteobacteria bacterium]|nr:PEGA domain-containing protein [Deltaproteobacteria bacterium]